MAMDIATELQMNMTFVMTFIYVACIHVVHLDCLP